MRTIRFAFIFTLVALTIASCKKENNTTDTPVDYSYLIEGSWSETYRAVVTSTDTTATGDTLTYPKGKFYQTFANGTVTYFESSKKTGTRKFSFDGTLLTIFDVSAQEGSAEAYTTNFSGNNLFLNRKRQTSNGVIYFTEETNLKLEKY